MMLSSLGFGLDFKQRHFPENFKYLVVNKLDKKTEIDHDFAKELEIPSKYILMNKTNKTVCAVPIEEE